MTQRMLIPLIDVESTVGFGAIFSPCRIWRYVLWRIWDKSLPTCAFIGLNPSTADETQDDPTVRRCINFARDWGYGGLVMLNVFGFRATDPHDMKAAADPIGPENDSWLWQYHQEAELTVAAWGVHGRYQDRGRAVYDRLRQCKLLMCLGTTNDGEPRHPLYLKRTLKPQPFDYPD